MHDENDVRGYSWRGSIVQCLQWINFHLLKCFLNVWLTDSLIKGLIIMIDWLFQWLIYWTVFDTLIFQINLDVTATQKTAMKKTIILQICMRSNCTPPCKKAILIQKTSFSFLHYHVSPNSWTFNHEINLINQTQPTIPWTALFKPPPSASYKFINYTNDLNRNLFVWLIRCWLTDWSTDWLTDRQIDWLTDGLIAYWPTKNFIDWLTHVWLIE